MDEQKLRIRGGGCPNCGADLDIVGLCFEGAIYYPLKKASSLATWREISCGNCSLVFEIRGGWICPVEPYKFQNERLKDRKWK